MTIFSDRIWQRLFRTRPADTLPHTVEHQRIYIVPTKRGAAFLVTLLLMLIASVNYALSLGYALCFLLTGLFAATLLHTYQNLSGIQVKQISATDVFAGQSMPFTISLANVGRETRHGIRLATRNVDGLKTRLEGQDEALATLNLPTSSRGRQPLGRLTLQSDWPLGLWTCWSYLHVPAGGVAFPLPETDPPPLPLVNDSLAGDQHPSGIQGDVSGLRDYVPGDSIGSIAWKSAARGVGLQVRTFDTDGAPAKAVLTLQTSGKHQTEDQLARLCAWALKAEAARTEYALDLPGNRIDSGMGQDHRQLVLRALALHGVHT